MSTESLTLILHAATLTALVKNGAITAKQFNTELTILSQKTVLSPEALKIMTSLENELKNIKT